VTLTLVLPPELEQRLQQASDELHIAAPVLALQILDQNLPTPDRRSELIALLQTWMEDEDNAEQEEISDDLLHALDEDRLSQRKLFPEELRGVTW